jgi:hypothetical protein
MLPKRQQHTGKLPKVIAKWFQNATHPSVAIWTNLERRKGISTRGFTSIGRVFG